MKKLALAIAILLFSFPAIAAEKSLEEIKVEALALYKEKLEVLEQRIAKFKAKPTKTEEEFTAFKTLYAQTNKEYLDKIDAMFDGQSDDVKKAFRKELITYKLKRKGLSDEQINEMLKDADY